MTPKEAIEKAIRHFKCVRDDAQVVLDSGFGTHEGENDLVYRNRKMYAELAIEALEKQIPKKPIKLTYKLLIDAGWIYACPNCKMACGENKYHLEATSDEMYCPSCGQAIDFEELE